LAGLIGVARTVAGSLLLAVAGAAWAAAVEVGEVSLAIGVGRVVGAAGNHTAARGTKVQVGDRIETERGGHVHLRFIDGAYVSVRPGSRLYVESYSYDAANPGQNAVRFRLEQGVVRSITGKLAERARDRFRLNTPIAAIGVRGTDFVVLAEADQVRVAVNRGAIVLAPLGEGCAANTLGPCATAAARTLSADMGQVMLEFRPQQGAPRVVPVNGIPSPDRLNPPTPEEPRAGAGSRETASETTTEVLAAQAIPDRVDPVQPAPPPVQPPPVQPPPTQEPALVWGRWLNQPWPGDTQSQPYADARTGRTVTVGNQQYVLFRADSPLTSLVSNLGRVDFTLREAQVHLVRGSAVELGRVDSGWLSVDFAARQFGTGLALSHPQAGSASLQAAGSVRNDGIFVVRNADGRVAGALALDGSEAGYFFERVVPLGTFIGITRWSR
jgi:hypothetical protein